MRATLGNLPCGFLQTAPSNSCPFFPFLSQPHKINSFSICFVGGGGVVFKAWQVYINKHACITLIQECHRARAECFSPTSHICNPGKEDIRTRGELRPLWEAGRTRRWVGGCMHACRSRKGLQLPAALASLDGSRAGGARAKKKRGGGRQPVAVEPVAWWEESRRLRLLRLRLRGELGGCFRLRPPVPEHHAGGIAGLAWSLC